MSLRPQSAQPNKNEGSSVVAKGKSARSFVGLKSNKKKEISIEKKAN